MTPDGEQPTNPFGRKETQTIWVSFPKPEPTGDALIDVLETGKGPPPPGPGETRVKITIEVNMKNSEGPMISQVGCTLDVFAEIARTSGATAALLFAMWDKPESEE